MKGSNIKRVKIKCIYPLRYLFLKDKEAFQWRIYTVKFWTRVPSQSNFLYFHAVFGKNCKIKGWRLFLYGWHPFWEILDPPLLSSVVAAQLTRSPWQLHRLKGFINTVGCYTNITQYACICIPCRILKICDMLLLQGTDYPVHQIRACGLGSWTAYAQPV